MKEEKKIYYYFNLSENLSDLIDPFDKKI